SCVCWRRSSASSGPSPPSVRTPSRRGLSSRTGRRSHRASRPGTTPWCNGCSAARPCSEAVSPTRPRSKSCWPRARPMASRRANATRWRWPRWPRCSCYSTCLSTTSNRPVPRFRMKNEHQLRSEICQFVLDDLLMGDTASMLDDGESFLETGTIDSIGVLDIVMFLEHNFQLKVQDRELVPENLDSVNRLVQFVMRKTHAA